MSTKPKTGDMLLKLDACEGLRKYVSGVDDPGSMLDLEVVIFNLRVNEVVTNVDMF